MVELEFKPSQFDIHNVCMCLTDSLVYPQTKLSSDRKYFEEILNSKDVGYLHSLCSLVKVKLTFNYIVVNTMK